MLGEPLIESYGRRRGRPLRPRRKALLENLLPQVAIPPGDRPLDPRALFQSPYEDVWLEIGFGAGEHLAHQAATHPAIGFIGCEPYLNGIAALLARIEAGALRNIRVAGGDVRLVLPRLPTGSIGRAFILFPDPWPKARHHKRRLIQPSFVDMLARVLRPAAELRLASDHPGYVAWMLERLARHPDFIWLARRPADWRERSVDWPATRYETKALALGRKPVFLRFERR